MASVCVEEWIPAFAGMTIGELGLAVLVSHMPARTQRAVRALSVITRHIGVPIMKHYRV